MYGVLIIEDDPQVAQMTADFLTQNGYSVAGIAGGAEQALEYLRRERIQLILLDIYLPGISGLEILRRLRMEQSQAEAIIVSAAKDSVQIREAFRMGCVDYIIKPFTYARLSEALNKFENRSALLKKNCLSQSEVDRLSGECCAAVKLERDILPKGIDRYTLQRICEALMERKHAFCVQDIAVDLELSRVSVKKYLDFLVGERLLQKTYIYGSVGRPVNEYRIVTGPAARGGLECWGRLRS